MKTANIVKPKYWRKDNSIKSITVYGKTWFDKVNGNTYCASQVTVNKGFKNEFSFKMPFTYGYGDYYVQMSIEALITSGLINKEKYWEFRHSADCCVSENCLKRDVIAWGK